MINDSISKKIIVTGGAGFIGSNIVKKLNYLGIDNILIIDDVGQNKHKKSIVNNLNFDTMISINDFIEDLDNFKNISCVFHQGACSDTMNHDKTYMLSNNSDYSLKILNHCLNQNADFIFASSASVYGKGKKGFIEDKNNEMPLNIYAESKLLVDNEINNVLEQNLSSQVLSLRYFNVYGFPEFHKGRMASVPFHFFNQIKSNNTIKLFEGSDNYYRDFIFIDDIINIISHLTKSKISGIYNAGTGFERSFQEMADITKELYPKINIETIPFPENLKNYYQKKTKADTSKLYQSGYNSPATSLEKGLAKYYLYLENSKRNEPN